MPRKEQYQRWKKNNPEIIKKLRDYNKKWNTENKEKCVKYCLKWQKKNPNKVRDWKEANKDKRVEYSFKSYYKNKDKIIPKKYKATKLFRKKYPEKYKAQQLAKTYIKIPKRYKCDVCKKQLAKDRHHPDYSKPFMVYLVCRSCHYKLNEGIIK
jgi:hypothetical protein